MISPKFFVDSLLKQGVEFYAGVPDSLLKNMCAYITDTIDENHHIIAANEGGAVALAAGYHLATGKTGCVYMQNSGEGNAINPIASLTDPDVYNIPLLLLIGWRGRPGVHDEPQHLKQGKVTTRLLDTMGIPFDVLSKDEAKAGKQIAKAIAALNNNETYAFVIERDTFDDYKLQNIDVNNFTMSREEAVQAVAAALGRDVCIVSTTGMISRELFEYRTANAQSHEQDFLTVGSMGHASQIALGIAVAQPHRRVCCFDGDGAAIMHMGGIAIIASKAPKNYLHVVFNNGAHDSVGGQPTAGLEINLPAAAKAFGYKAAYSVERKQDLVAVLSQAKNLEGPIMIEVKVKKGNRKDLGRPTTTPVENKEALIHFLQSAGRRDHCMQLA